jgi:hypothetical protein
VLRAEASSGCFVRMLRPDPRSDPWISPIEKTAEMPTI